jgi:hypothetical protein
MGSPSSALEAALARAGFRATSTQGHWRDNQLRRVPFRLYAKEAGEGEHIELPAVTADYVVLVKAS